MNDDPTTTDDTRLRHAGDALRQEGLALQAPSLTGAARRRSRRRVAATAVLTSAFVLGVTMAATAGAGRPQPVPVATASGFIEPEAPTTDEVTTAPTSEEPDPTTAGSSEPGPDTLDGTAPGTEPSAPQTEDTAGTTPGTDLPMPSQVTAPDPTEPPMTVTAPPTDESVVNVHVVRADDWLAGPHGFEGQPGTPLDGASIRVTRNEFGPNGEVIAWDAGTSGTSGPGALSIRLSPGGWFVNARLLGTDSCDASGGTMVVSPQVPDGHLEATIVVSTPDLGCIDG